MSLLKQSLQFTRQNVLRRIVLLLDPIAHCVSVFMCHFIIFMRIFTFEMFMDHILPQIIVLHILLLVT